LLNIFRSPLDIGEVKGFDVKDREKVIARMPNNDEPFSGIAFKIATDPFVGTLTYFRIYSGELKAGSQLFNPLENKKERVGKILQMHANKRDELQAATAGDIIAITGLKYTSTGQTLCVTQKPIIFDLMNFPETVISIAIEPKTAADEDKLQKVLDQLLMEDPSFKYMNNKETGQLLIYGMGELHLEIIADRLEREFKVGVNIGKPQVSYRESIKNVATASNEYSREVGGKLQYGQATIEVTPITNEDVVFENTVKNREVPKEIYAAIERGIKDAVPGGAMAGYPFIGIKATLKDLKYDEENAAEVAYTIAASMAFKEACQKAGMILMEPIMDLEVITPVDYSGDVISDINAKRGKIQGMNPKNDKEVVKATVPLAEMFGYSTALRSKTQGRANFTMTFLKYERMEHALAKSILEKRGIYID
jgi:elongation factor G